MKIIITIIAIIFTSTISNAQDIFQQKMGEALTYFGNVENPSDYKTAAGNFEIISNVNTTEWLPLYYHAQCYILMSFNDQSANKDQKDAYLTIAESSLDKMIHLTTTESEIYALQALFYTAKLVIDPMTRGQKYGGLTQMAIQKSLAHDQNNPRAKQLNLSNKMGTAQYFGQDISPFCEEVNILLADWDNYKSKGAFYPTWGKNQLLSLSQQCSNANETEKKETPIEKQTTETIITSEKGNTLTLNVNKLKSNKGYLMLELLDENEKTVQQVMGVIKDNTCTVVIDGLAEGVYAVRFYHDANENKKMDTNKYGAPQENYGFSNNAKGFMSAPKYKKRLFHITENTTLAMKAR